MPNCEADSVQTQNGEHFFDSARIEGLILDFQRTGELATATADGLSAAEIAATLKQVFERGPRQPIHGRNGPEPPISPPPTPQPEPGMALPSPIPDGLKVLLETCFEEKEYVAISDTTRNTSGEPKPHAGHCYSREAWLA